jgi:glucose-1-phosphate adenylyltransferase
VILPDVKIGHDCRIPRVVIDKACVIPDGMVIGEDAAADRARFHVTPAGVTLVTPSMLGQHYSAKTL